jgi:hypothetical protein
MAKQLAFYFNSGQCSGCKAGQMACEDKHDLEVGLTGGAFMRYPEVAGFLFFCRDPGAISFLCVFLSGLVLIRLFFRGPVFAGPQSL